MLSAALLEAQAQGELVQPLLTVDYAVRGHSLGLGIYGPAKVSYPGLGTVTKITATGGWKEITYGSGVKASGGDTLVVSADVKVVDSDGALLRFLEVYDPRGSAVAGRWAAASVVPADWTSFFTGILSDWDNDSTTTTLILKTDDTLLRTPVPKAVFLKAEWGSAFEATIFGTAMPIVLGIHDAFLLTARGALPCFNIRYDKDIGYWYLVAANRMKTIRRVYFDGKPQPATIWTTVYGVFGGNFLTILSITPPYQPEKNVVVAVDAEGPDSDGRIVGDPIVNPVSQLRAILQEWVFRASPPGAWRGPIDVIDADSWDAGAAYFDLHGYDSAVHLGGDQNADTGAGIIDTFLKAYPWVRICWNEHGKLVFAVLDHDEPERDDSVAFDLKAAEGGAAKWTPGDLREVYTEVKQPYLRLTADMKYAAALAAQDPAALPQRLPISIDNPWSQARFTED